jgi:DNA-binding NtrC family response regulator
MSDSILLVDDDAVALRVLGTWLADRGFEVARELDAAGALLACDRLTPDVVVLRLSPAGKTPGLLAQLVDRGIAVLALAEEDEVADALHHGASQVLPRGADPSVVGSAATRVGELARLRRCVAELLNRDGTTGRLEALGASAVMKAVAQQVPALAQSERTTVLVTGPPGVGKAWVARLIHDSGPRAAEPFLEASCNHPEPAATESRLFGHEHGARAGSTGRHRGLLEVAGRGTVLIREVSALPPELQPIVLRAIESRSVRRAGGLRDVPIAARLITTTSRTLQTEVDAGRFREDLAYRLNTVVLRMPPLAERSENDRVALIETIHRRLAGKIPAPPPIAAEAMERLVAYGWPGNVREMATALEGAAFRARDQVAILVEHLPGELRARPGLGDRRHNPVSLEEVERRQIESSLRFHGGNRTRAAKELRISRATLINKIKRYAITD